MLNNFLRSVDFDAVKRIKHRLFVVGRFNDNKPGPFPELFLFKHPNRSVSPQYADNFVAGGVGELSFRSFLDKLKPTVYEVIEPTRQRGRFTQVKMLPPSQVLPSQKRAEGQYPLNELNWFVLRGFATTRQEAFRDSHPNLPEGLLTQDPADRGREIYKLIRRSLKVFGQFQPRTYLLIEAFSELFGELGEYAGLPAFGAGNPLPSGFPEALIDFLYLEDSEQRFSLKNVDLSEDAWAQLRDPQSAGSKMFCTVVSAFRDEAIGKSQRQYHAVRPGGRSVHDLAKGVLDEDLLKEFRIAREAYTGLRQILRGKVLISMVLQWVLQSLDEIPDVKNLGPRAQAGPKDRAKGRAILERWKENGLARPILRASKEERRRFSRELGRNFDLVLRAALSVPDVLSRLYNVYKDLKRTSLSKSQSAILATEKQQLESQLPDGLLENSDILELALKLAQDDTRLALLRGLTGKKLGEDYQGSFIRAAKILLTDVMCPTLFQDPIFTKDQLRHFFRSETMTVYLMAVFMDNNSKDATVRVAEAHQGEFQHYVDSETRMIRDAGKLQSKLLDKFVDVITRDELRERLDSAEKVLSEAYTVLENTPARLGVGDGTRVSGITTFVPDPIYRRALEVDPSSVTSTEVPESDLLSVVELIALKQAQPLIFAKVKAASTAAAMAYPSDSEHLIENPVGKRSEQSVPGDGAGDSLGAASEQFSPTEGDDASAQDSQEMSQTEQNIASIVNQIVEALPGSAFDSEHGLVLVNTKDRALDVAQQVRQRVEARHSSTGVAPADDKLSIDVLQEMKDNMRAFQSALFLIYQRYNENQDKRDFTNNVDRFTLVNLMLLFQNELGLGDVHSSLMHLLLDLVLHLDVDDPDPKAFLEEQSLTKYFDNDLVDSAGMTSLRQVLEMQANTNLQAMINLVSELMGIRHLIESVRHDEEAEVIVVNATATEFLNWVSADNLNVQRGAQSRLNPIQLAAKLTSDSAIPPGLVYLSDAAFEFDFDKKRGFLDDLQNLQLMFNQVSVVLPPLCVSTGRQSEDWSNSDWFNEGVALEEAAANAPCPVIVLGPSSFLNNVGDVYGTFIPAGYVFGAHFLSRPYQGLRNQHVSRQGEKRFFSLGFGSVTMKDSLDRVIWGRSEKDDCAFAADFYLYIVLVILGSTFRAGAPLPGGLNWSSYYDCFYNTVPELVNHVIYDSSEEISEALYGARSLYRGQHGDITRPPAYHYAMAEQLSVPGTQLKSILLQPPGRDIWLKIGVDWFERARNAAGLP